MGVIQRLSSYCGYPLSAIPTQGTPPEDDQPIDHAIVGSKADAGLIGRGYVPMPGEVLLAHNGTRFPNTLPEYCRRGLEALPQRRENGVTNIPVSRTSGTYGTGRGGA